MRMSHHRVARRAVLLVGAVVATPLAASAQARKTPAADIEKRTGGSLKVEVYPASSLVKTFALLALEQR